MIKLIGKILKKLQPNSLYLKLKKIYEIIIKSNCTYLGPVVFTYKQDYIDVYPS